MPTFCRHNRFIERCPICSKTLPGARTEPAPAARRGERTRSRSTSTTTSEPRGARRTGSAGVRVRHEDRAQDDGYRSELVPGIRASADALRLVEEIAFASGRLAVLSSDPPGLYGEAQALVHRDIERASWTCLLLAYLSPLEGDQPFIGIETALSRAPVLPSTEQLPSLEAIPLGPRSSHEPSRGEDTLHAFLQWVGRTGGGEQMTAFTGDPAWSPERRFERLFERLALPGLGRVGRYELLLTLGRLGCYELHPASLYLASGRGEAAEDPTTLAAKRIFGIGERLLLNRRATVLAEAAKVPVEALDLALANWGAGTRMTVGVAAQRSDESAYERAGEALGL